MSSFIVAYNALEDGSGGGGARKAALAALGLDGGESAGELRKAYRAKAAKHHPDRGGDRAAYERVVAAYKTLSEGDVTEGGAGGGGRSYQTLGAAAGERVFTTLEGFPLSAGSSGTNGGTAAAEPPAAAVFVRAFIADVPRAFRLSRSAGL